MGYVFMSDKSGFVYLVNNDDGALAYGNLHLFQTYSSVTGAECRKIPMTLTQIRAIQEIRAIRGDPSNPGDPGDPGDPSNPGEPGDSGGSP